jgi:hypothetical protein
VATSPAWLFLTEAMIVRSPICIGSSSKVLPVLQLSFLLLLLVLVLVLLLLRHTSILLSSLSNPVVYTHRVGHKATYW